MANPRELAEKAFTLLQSALSDSEARASELDEQLKRKRTPKNRVEEQLDVLTHRLESVEAERARWEQQAGHLEEVAEAERVKVGQLKKKLEIAESGPEKLTKKEINFWRAKAESIDVEITEYKNRLAGLRRELNERDASIEKFQASPGTAPAERTEPETHAGDPSGELRRQLEQRDRWLAELRLELHEQRGQPAPPLEVQAEVETLQTHIAGLERALADAHNMHAAVQADLKRTEQQITERERVIREATAINERARATLSERDHRIVELSAEVEQLRQRDLQQRDSGARHDEQVSALTRDVDALRMRIEQDQQDAAAASAALRNALSAREREAENQRELLTANETDFKELRRQLAEREHAAADAYRQLDELRRELYEHGQELVDNQQHLRELGKTLADRDRQIATAAGDLEHARATLAANDRELSSLRGTLLGSSRELDELRAHKQRLEESLEELAAAREQIAGLEGELKEEREHAESLGELANERREHMTKLQEQLEEAEERYADANWRLGKSLHFERIVKRRKGLVVKLLAALRAKMKSNTALKAGLDGLRTHKAAAEMDQQKLLKRIDALKAEVSEAEETVKRHQGGTVAKEELTNAISRATTLEDRLNTQAELIQTLEADLKTARLAHKPSDKGPDIERMTHELETKNQLIAQLQADTDEQQRKLSKLRGSESETVRLKALTDKDRSEIDAMQHEITQLRDALARQAMVGETPATANNAELEAKLKEREHSVTRLMGTIKEHEATIKKLTESSDSWKRKYQFLATDSPEAYKAAAEK